MKDLSYIPDYEELLVVHSLKELLNFKFNTASRINTVIFPRELAGDFNGLAQKIKLLGSGYWEQFNLFSLKIPHLTRQEKQARKHIQSDIRAINNYCEPSLTDKFQEVDIQYSPLSQAYFWHIDGTIETEESEDRKQKETERYFISYTAACTQFVKNSDATKRQLKNFMIALKPDAKPWSPQCGDIVKFRMGNNVPNETNFAIHNMPIRQTSLPRLFYSRDNSYPLGPT